MYRAVLGPNGYYVARVSEDGFHCQPSNYNGQIGEAAARRAEAEATALNRRYSLAKREQAKLANKAIVRKDEKGGYPAVSAYLVDDYSGDLYRLVKYRPFSEDAGGDERPVIVESADWSELEEFCDGDDPAPDAVCWLLLNAVRA